MGGLSVGACDHEQPEYETQDAILRLVPRVSSIGPDGGDVFVLVELTRKPVKDESIIFVDARDARIVALPGPSLCPAGSGGSDGNGGSGGGLDVDPKSGTTTSTRVVIPAAALLADDVRSNVYETGVIVSIPAGARDALLVASAYSYTGDSEECSPTNVQLAAVASTTISRITPGASGGEGPDEGGQPTVGGASGTPAGGTGGSATGGSTTGGSTMGGSATGGSTMGGSTMGGMAGEPTDGMSGAAGAGGGIK